MSANETVAAIQSKANSTIYTAALRVIDLRDGTALIFHHFTNPDEKATLASSEPSPILAEFLNGVNGTRHREFASNWVPPRTEAAASGNVESVLPGTVGQFYGGTIFEDGKTVALSIGWFDLGSHGNNGIVIGRRGRSTLALGGRNLILTAGAVRDLAPGPGNLLVGITGPRKGGPANGPSLVTVFDTNGGIHGEFFPQPGEPDPLTIARNAGRCRIERLGRARYALYDDHAQLVRLFELSFPEGLAADPSPGLGASGRGQWASVKPSPDVHLVSENVTSVLSLPEGTVSTRTPITQAFHVAKDGSILIVRTIVNGTRPTTIVTRYDTVGRIIGSWSPGLPFRTSYFSGETLVGVVTASADGDVFLDSVTF